MDIKSILESALELDIPLDIPGGDMPGDRINVSEAAIRQAKTLLPDLLLLLEETFGKNDCEKAVISIAGGSGAGKSVIASVLAYMLNQSGTGCYLMSGDNYPLRIPAENDAERLRIFRNGGIKALRDADLLTAGVVESVRVLQKTEKDADPSVSEKFKWFETYIKGGEAALSRYIGTPCEQDYSEINSIINSFKNGSKQIWFKRMGRDNTALWYDKLDMSDKKILILEWTHASNENVKNTDIPIFLRSTPEETLEYRMLRARDSGADSPFTTMVLGIEQKLLDESAKRAKIILTRNGKLIEYKDYFN